MPKVLVTGASGFIGKALVRCLEASGIAVLPCRREDGHIQDSTTLGRFEDEDVSRVFHLAAQTFIPESWKNQTAVIEANVLGTSQVTAFCERKSCALTFVSAYVYGRPERLPIAESDRILPNNPYALSKHLAEQICEFHHRSTGLSVSIVRPFNVYGPTQDSRFLIPSILQQVLRGPEIRVKDLHPRRDYVYVDDVLDGLLRTTDIAGGFQAFNLGSGHSTSVSEIIEVAQRIANTRWPVYSDGESRRDEIPDVVADATRARQLLGWKPAVSLETGLRNILERLSA